MSITLAAAIWTRLQGILLTAEALGFFITAMMLMPKINAASTEFWRLGRNPANPTETAQSSTTSNLEEQQDASTSD